MTTFTWTNIVSNQVSVPQCVSSVVKWDFLHQAFKFLQGAFISSCLFVPSALHWLLPWSSCPDSWPGLWVHWGCWWEHQGTEQNGTPAGLSLAPGRQGAGLAWARDDAVIGAVSSTHRCGLRCRQPACPSLCLHRVWQQPDCSSGSEHTKEAAEPDRSTHAHFSWSGLSASRESAPYYTTVTVQDFSEWSHGKTTTYPTDVQNKNSFLFLLQ